MKDNIWYDLYIYVYIYNNIKNIKYIYKFRLD